MQATSKTIETESQVLALLESGDRTNRDLSDHFEVTVLAMAHILRRLVKRGEIEKIPNGSRCNYRINRQINITRIKLTNRQDWRVR